MVSVECLTINNSMNSILIPEITIINDYTSASYPLVVRNEGKYDAYLDTSWLTEEDGALSEFYYGTCTAEPETQQSLVDLASQNVVTILNVKITAGNEYNQQE